LPDNQEKAAGDITSSIQAVKIAYIDLCRFDADKEAQK
jgi:hypothetical protein